MLRSAAVQRASIWLLQGLGLVAVVVGLRLKDPFVFLVFAVAVAAAVIGGRRLFEARAGTGAVESLFDAHPRTTQAALATVLLAFPFIFAVGFRNPYWIYVATLAGIYVALALGLNIVVGLAGLLDLGYVAFYAIGAYTSALVSLHFDVWWALWLWVPGSILVAAGLGVVLGFPTLRLRGDYLAIVTLGFGEIVRIVLNNWDSVTNGPKGLADIPAPRIGGYALSDGIAAIPWWGKELNFYLVTLAYAVFVAVIAKRLDASRLGRAWRAIREDELAARAMGIDTTRAKLSAFAIGAGFAGVAGLLFAHMQTFIDPMSFVFMESAIILCMVVLGGMGSIPGVVLGAVILAALPEKLRDFQDYRMLAFGLALVAMMVLRPQGLLPAVREGRAASAAKGR